MTEKTDGQLLGEFATEGSAAAFEQVVRRHMDWVYSCAQRRLRDAHGAEDVAQAVFILLAQKAKSVMGHAHIGGWLFRATRYCAANAIRQQARRAHHEQEAGIMQAQTVDDDAATWQAVLPVLDEAVTGLKTSDREAVLLRFYEQKTIVEVARFLGIGEAAAKKRVERAVKRLRAAMIRKGVSVSEGGLASVMAVQVTHAAPAGMVGAAVAASAGGVNSATAGIIARAAGKLMWWAKAKLAAMVVIGVLGAGAVGVVVHTVAMKRAGSSGGAAVAGQTVSGQAAASEVFDVLYENASGSGPGLSMQVGPNTFAVTAVVRYGADGKPVATDGRGKAIDASTLPLEKIGTISGGQETVIVFLQPGRERYDIGRLRIFDHMTRYFISNVVVEQVPGLSALRISAAVGALPKQIDLWMAVASYDAGNIPVNLPAKKEATVKVGDAVLGFEDIRDGQWNVDMGKFTTVNTDEPQTTLMLKATGDWNVGRYQIAAVSTSGQKCVSDFFVDLSTRWAVGGPIFFFPFGLEQIDHFELRPLAQQPPFYFDGINLPTVVEPAGAASPILQAVIVKAAAGASQVQLPSGATVEMEGIGDSPLASRGWWGLDGRPVALAIANSGGSVTDYSGHTMLRQFAARLLAPARGTSEVLWQFSPGASYASSESRRQSTAIAAVDRQLPVNVRVGAAVTPWQTVEDISSNDLPAHLKCWPGEIEDLDVTANGTSLSAATISLPENLRIVLIDQAGNAHVQNGESIRSHENFAPWGYAIMRLTFDGLMPEDVRSIQFQTRREEFAEFDNVPLLPK